MKIAIVVPGRFHAFDLCKALRDRGHDVVLYTNYPKRVVAQFGVDPKRVKSCLWHGVLLRLIERLSHLFGFQVAEKWIHRSFGRWAARRLKRQSFDVVHLWSGVAEESLIALRGSGVRTWLMRGSAHIEVQAQLLEEEAQRAGQPVERPTDWLIDRELREYSLADRVIVLSTFSVRSFVEKNFPIERLSMVPLGVDVSSFTASRSIVEERYRRIVSGSPLRVLYVGAVSRRKGMHDLLTVLQQLPAGDFEVQIVGPIAADCVTVARDLGEFASLKEKQQQGALPREYNLADLFVFPTIEDGFAAVLAQAQAAGLPILATENCGAPDLLEEGVTGWVVPIRQPSMMLEHLLWADEFRAKFASMTKLVAAKGAVRTWDDVALSFEQLLAAEL